MVGFPWETDVTMTEPAPILIQGDARRLPLADASVDLIVTSPPYWSLRSYRDAGQHYAGQIGSEPTAAEYLDALIECTREWMRVLKPTGSIWCNLGDKFASSDSEIPAKSLYLLPHRYAIRCVDELGLITRQDQVWQKANGLPESVTDRTRRSHEYLFHMVKQPRYYSAVNDIRERYEAKPQRRFSPQLRDRGEQPSGSVARTASTLTDVPRSGINPLGKLPGSVWEIPSQPMNVPDRVAHARCCGGRKREGCEDGLDHYAAWPFALVRPIILGWSPREVCTACREGRRPVAVKKRVPDRPGRVQGRAVDALLGGHGADGRAGSRYALSSAVTGYACACTPYRDEESRYFDHEVDEWVTLTTRVLDFENWVRPVSTPGVIVDPFGGTGAAALVAVMAGRTGISVDASWDYTDVIARWRVNDPKERARAAGLDSDAVSRVNLGDDRQGSLLDLLGATP